MPLMPDLHEPADTRGGNREVVDGGWRASRRELDVQVADTSGLRLDARPQPSTGLTTVHQPPSILLLDKVSKWYGPVIGVNQVTLELWPGITGLVGANGSGKSTLLRLA